MHSWSSSFSGRLGFRRVLLCHNAMSFICSELLSAPSVRFFVVRVLPHSEEEVEGNDG